LLSNAGVDPADFTRSNNKISVASYFSILDEAVRLSEDPFWGLHMGEFFEWRNLSNLGDIMNPGYIMAGCRNLGQAIRKASEHLQFHSSPFDLEIFINGNLTEITFIPKHIKYPSISHCIDEALSSFVKIVRSLTQKFIKLKAVRMLYDPPSHTGEYRRIFACPVFFSQPTTALVFNSRDLLAPIVTENAGSNKSTAHSSKALSEDIDGINAYSKKISLLLNDHLQKGSPCIKEVAKDLGVSVRCLQMKLSREGETFSHIVKNVRKELAKAYLMEKDYSIDEITYLLGFSDPSVFHRAFKAWTGLTPGQYRNTL
jgi:AraC-like DNA-binding protein